MFKRWAVSVVVGVVLTGMIAEGQTAKKGGKAATAASASYRTLTGKVTEAKAADQMVTIQAGGEGTKGGQSWLLSVGKQTLLLRAGRNGQFAAAEFSELKPGDTVQAVANLQADPSDRSHTAWWLVVYPAGTTPPAR